MLIAPASVGIGVAIGSSAHRFQRVTAIGITPNRSLFPEWWHYCGCIPSSWLQAIAHFIPTFYGSHALQTATFYSSTEGLAQDISVLVETAFATIALGAFSLGRSTLA